MLHRSILAALFLLLYPLNVFALDVAADSKQNDTELSQDNISQDNTSRQDDAKPANSDMNEKEKVAFHEKELADFLSRHNKQQQAADLFVHSIILAPQLYTIDEKVSIAQFLIAMKRRTEAIEMLKAAIKEPHSGFKAELALAKALSETEKTKIKRESKYYVYAIQLASGNFSNKDKLQIAKKLIKQQQRQDALTILKMLIYEPHDDYAPETLLAKLRVSTGDYDNALQDANDILEQDDKNVGALHIKGKELRRRKDFGAAIKAYQDILEKNDDFDARIGLSYCLLAIGKKQEAEYHFRRLHPQDQWQKMDYNDLARTIASKVRPRIDYTNSKFTDSDNYQGEQHEITGKMNIADWDVSVSAQKRSASGEGIQAFATTGLLSLGKTLSPSWHLSLAGGVTNLGLDQSPSANTGETKAFNIGELKVDTQILGGTAQYAYSKKLLTANAVLIQNAVEIERSQFIYNKLFGNRFRIKTLWRNNQYSDDNLSREFEGTALLTVYQGFAYISLGYDHHQFAFEKPTLLGYFDPQQYKDNKWLLLTAYEHGSFYLYTEYATGNQRYFQHQIEQSGKLTHLGVASGLALGNDLRFELSMEQNNADAKSANYVYGDSSISAKLSYSL